MSKLVRDKIPQIIKDKGESANFHIASDEEYKATLYEKLQEECAEFSESGSNEELADILEVLHAIYDIQHTTPEAIEQIRAEKAEKRGAFKEKIILDE